MFLSLFGDFLRNRSVFYLAAKSSHVYCVFKRAIFEDALCFVLRRLKVKKCPQGSKTHLDEEI